MNYNKHLMFHCSHLGLPNNTKSLIVMEMLHKLEDKENYVSCLRNGDMTAVAL